MAATVHRLHPPSAPLAGFLRVGHTGKKKLEALHAARRFPYRRVVFDAAHLAEQIGLLERLRTSGCEIAARSPAVAFRGGGGAVAAMLGR
jgi:hypothetical protein